MLFVAGNKTPRDSGNQKFEKDGVAASGIRCDLGGAPPLKKRAMTQNTKQKSSSPAGSPKAQILFPCQRAQLAGFMASA
jgi:hypothetical protein